jgi:hypothetical protein
VWCNRSSAWIFGGPEYEVSDATTSLYVYRYDCLLLGTKWNLFARCGSFESEWLQLEELVREGHMPQPLPLTSQDIHRIVMSAGGF